MISPQKFSWEQLYSFFRALNSSTSFNLETIRRRYNDKSKNFEGTIILLQELNIVRIKNGQIIAQRELTQAVLTDIQKLKIFFVDILFSKESILKSYQIFFEGFVPHHNSYIYKPVMRERLKYSEIRNFLIDIGVLEYNKQLKGYISRGKLIEYLNNRSKTYSYSQFIKESKKQVELGYKAEILVYKKELKTFTSDPVIQKKIRHVSLENVSAGYDIESVIKQKDGIITPVYIEVKAVASKDFKFFWSRNEMEKAKLYKDRYFLYLLPVSENNIIDMKFMIKIKNPYINILNNRSWENKCELMSFWK